MAEMYTISRLARAAGIPATTVRYYERIGLVEPEERTAGNYRLYSEESLRKVKFIRAAQAIGFTLEDIQALLAVPDTSAASCQTVQPLIEERLADVTQRLKDLRHVQRVLTTTLKRCRESEQSGCCHVMATLRDSSMR